MQGRLPRKITSLAKPYARELAYLESTGTQYIDSGIVCSDDMELEITWADTGAYNSKGLFGCGHDNTRGYFVVFQNSLYVGQGKSADLAVTTLGVTHTLKVQTTAAGALTYTLDGTATTTTYTTPLDHSYSIHILNQNPYTRYRIALLYGFKIKKSGTLVRDCIPVMDAQGVACMYDRVSKTLLYNAGSGSFGYGEIADLPTGYTQLAYIESTGTQYIDTEWSAGSEHIKVECAVRYAEIGGNATFGSEIITDNYAWPITVYSRSSTVLAFWAGTSGDLCPQSVAVNTDYTISAEANNGTLTTTINGTSQTASYSGGLQNGLSLYIFGNHRAAGTQLSKMRLKWFKIYEGNTLVRDYVPCINASGSIGLYDTVGEQFYGNAGTGSFISGGAV